VRELLNLLAEFEKTGVHFKSLGDPWCDTTTPHGRLMLTVLGGLVAVAPFGTVPWHLGPDGQSSRRLVPNLRRLLVM
jgi:resolvase-like protein